MLKPLLISQSWRATTLSPVEPTERLVLNVLFNDCAATNEVIARTATPEAISNFFIFYNLTQLPNFTNKDEGITTVCKLINNTFPHFSPALSTRKQKTLWLEPLCTINYYNDIGNECTKAKLSHTRYKALYITIKIFCKYYVDNPHYYYSTV